MKAMTGSEVVALLGLEPHPEGGFYRQTFADTGNAPGRPISTLIYYLLTNRQTGAWHRVDASEVWHWYAGSTGFAHLRYHTRLRLRDKERVLVDRRENILVGEQAGDGRWGITCKIVLKAENYYE